MTDTPILDTVEETYNKDEEKPLEIIDKTPKEPEEDKTSWEEEDPWEIMKMSEQDIKEAEESRDG